MSVLFNHVTDDTFESLLRLSVEKDEVDLSGMEFIDPYCMLGVLEIGRFFNSHGIKKALLLPKSEDALKYMERMNFFRYAHRYFTPTLKPFLLRIDFYGVPLLMSFLR